MIVKLIKLTDYFWELPISYKKGMKVPVRIIASEKLISNMEETIFSQSANVASLPGLVGYVLILPDAHSGYGAPIGTVFATDPQKGGIISPGAVGYDINCGMRLITTNLKINEVKAKIDQLVDLLFDYVPAGVGAESSIKLKKTDLDKIMIEGAKYIVEQGLGWSNDLEAIEEKGMIKGANPERVSEKAYERGKYQLATLGSGNHYLEIQKVEKIFDEKKAKEFGIFSADQIMIMFHCGSRGFGHQIATDYLRIFEKRLDKYNIKVDDLQLACAPFNSKDGQNYFQAMAAASNFAFANRQVITHRIRQAFEKVFQVNAQSLGLKLVADVAHNIAKIEEQISTDLPADEHGYQRKSVINPRKSLLLIHRKGATRSFSDQPVIIGGSMETGSYFLLGTKKALELSFGSTAHGSGRTMSRHQAKKIVKGKDLAQQLLKKGIKVKSASYLSLAEESGLAYKNINDVVESVDKAGISKPVVSFRPIGNIKG